MDVAKMVLREIGCKGFYEYGNEGSGSIRWVFD
jgi:hypothetical protein